MIGFLVLLFPVVLMLFMLGMERLEEPLTRVAVEREVERMLEGADAEDLNTLVRAGMEPAVRRFRWRHRRAATAPSVSPARIRTRD